MSKLYDVENMYGQDFNIVTSNAPSNIITNPNVKLLPNIFLVSSPKDNLSNADNNYPSLFVTDYNGQPLQLTYPLYLNNGLSKSESLGYVYINIDNETIQTNNNSGSLYVDTNNLTIATMQNKGVVKVANQLTGNERNINYPNNTYININNNGVLYITDSLFDWINNKINIEVTTSINKIKSFLNNNLKVWINFYPDIDNLDNYVAHNINNIENGIKISNGYDEDFGESPKEVLLDIHFLSFSNEPISFNISDVTNDYKIYQIKYDEKYNDSDYTLNDNKTKYNMYEDNTEIYEHVIEGIKLSFLPNYYINENKIDEIKYLFNISFENNENLNFDKDRESIQIIFKQNDIDLSNNFTLSGDNYSIAAMDIVESNVSNEENNICIIKNSLTNNIFKNIKDFNGDSLFDYNLTVYDLKDNVLKETESISEKINNANILNDNNTFEINLSQLSSLFSVDTNSAYYALNNESDYYYEELENKKNNNKLTYPINFRFEIIRKDINLKSYYNINKNVIINLNQIIFYNYFSSSYVYYEINTSDNNSRYNIAPNTLDRTNINNYNFDEAIFIIDSFIGENGNSILNNINIDLSLINKCYKKISTNINEISSGVTLSLLDMPATLFNDGEEKGTIDYNNNTITISSLSTALSNIITNITDDKLISLGTLKYKIIDNNTEYENTTSLKIKFDINKSLINNIKLNGSTSLASEKLKFDRDYSPNNFNFNIPNTIDINYNDISEGGNLSIYYNNFIKYYLNSNEDKPILLISLIGKYNTNSPEFNINIPLEYTYNTGNNQYFINYYGNDNNDIYIGNDGNISTNNDGNIIVKKYNKGGLIQINKAYFDSLLYTNNISNLAIKYSFYNKESDYTNEQDPQIIRTINVKITKSEPESEG